MSSKIFIANYNKKIFLVFIAFFAINVVYTQSKIKNNKLSYTISRKSGNLLDDSSSSSYVIKVKISNTYKRKIKLWPKSKWISLLKDENSDWYANVLLYEIYERNALLFNTVIKSRKDWLVGQKEKDIEYWENNLK